MDYLKVFALSVLIALPLFPFSQTTIPISNSLAAHAEILELTQGIITGKKIKKFHFNGYSMHSHDRIKSRTKRRENFFGTEIEIESTYSSSFRFSNILLDTAEVIMAHQTLDKTEKNLILGIFHFGDNELMNSDYFTSWININRDTNQTWTLFVGIKSGMEVDDMQDAYLSDGVRVIKLNFIRALEKGSNILGWPAMGYEFIEDGRSLGAIQIFNGKLSQQSNTVWIDVRLDKQTKFLLAAAMTALVHKPSEFD